NKPGVVGEEEFNVSAVIEIASARQSEQEGGIVGACATTDPRISGSVLRETDGALTIVAVNPAVPSLEVLEAELHIMLPFDPSDLFADAEGFAAGVSVHMRAIGEELGVVSSHLSFLWPDGRPRDLDGLPVSIIHAIDVARILDDVALVKANGEM